MYKHIPHSKLQNLSVSSVKDRRTVLEWKSYLQDSIFFRNSLQYLRVSSNSDVVPIWQKFYDIPRFRKWKGKPRFFACTKTLEGNAIMWLMSKFLERKKLLEPLLVINPSPAVSEKKEFASKKGSSGTDQKKVVPFVRTSACSSRATVDLQLLSIKRLHT